jgi:ribosomal protein L7Ae-like RNA K-turn-binding protein
MCTFYEVPIIELGSKEELGKWTGTEMRASLSVNDPGFASSIVKKYDSFREMEE